MEPYKLTKSQWRLTTFLSYITSQTEWKKAISLFVSIVPLTRKHEDQYSHLHIISHNTKQWWVIGGSIRNNKQQKKHAASESSSHASSNKQGDKGLHNKMHGEKKRKKVQKSTQEGLLECSCNATLSLPHLLVQCLTVNVLVGRVLKGYHEKHAVLFFVQSD